MPKHAGLLQHRVRRRLVLSWRLWWRDEAWSAIRRWSIGGILAMIGWAALVGVCEELARRSAPPRPPDAAGSAAHPLDPLIAHAAAERMPPAWDWRLLRAMVRKESGYDPDAVSPGGAVGLTQLLPATARHLGLSRGSFHDPEANLDAGTRYLRELYDRFHAVPDRAPDWERTRLAIASYNAGPGRVRSAVQAGGRARWSAVAPHLPRTTVRHAERIVEEFYPAFATIEADPDRPRIGRWKSSLRFWPTERPF